jgi:hypothetical protein
VPQTVDQRSLEVAPVPFQVDAEAPADRDAIQLRLQVFALGPALDDQPQVVPLDHLPWARGGEISFGESAPVPWRETRVFSHLRPEAVGGSV